MFRDFIREKHPCHEDGSWCPLQETFRLKHGVVGERGYPDAQGRERILQVATYPLFDSQSEVDLVIRLETDVTDKRLKISRSTLYSKIRRFGLENIYKGSISIQT